MTTHSKLNGWRRGTAARGDGMRAVALEESETTNRIRKRIDDLERRVARVDEAARGGPAAASSRAEVVVTFSAAIAFEIHDDFARLSGVYEPGTILGMRVHAHLVMRPTAHTRGSECHASKLTASAVLDIRSRLSSGPRGTGKALAAEYGVSPVAICRIGKRQAWGHL